MRLRLAVAGLLLPLLAACASETATPPPAAPPASSAPVVAKPIDVVRVAARKTTESGSARIALEVSAPGEFTMTGRGVFSLTELEGVIKMVMRGEGAKLEGEMRMLDNVLYTRMPQIPTDKPWLRFDYDELVDADVEAISQLQHNDPTRALAYLDGVSDDVREVGKEDVRGVATTRYAGTLDLEKARAAQTDSRDRRSIASTINKLGGIHKIPVEVWIDAEGRMRKMTQRLDIAKATRGAESGILLNTVEMYDFGVTVDVVAPAPGAVTDGAAAVKKIHQQTEQQPQ